MLLTLVNNFLTWLTSLSDCAMVKAFIISSTSSVYIIVTDTVNFHAKSRLNWVDSYLWAILEKYKQVDNVNWSTPWMASTHNGVVNQAHPSGGSYRFFLLEICAWFWIMFGTIILSYFQRVLVAKYGSVRNAKDYICMANYQIIAYVFRWIRTLCALPPQKRALCSD
jgi:hypothetical protein